MDALPSRPPAGKAMRVMADRERASHPPSGCNAGQRLDHERAARGCGMGDCQRARAPLPAAPVDDVEVEHPASPPASAAPAELALDRFKRAQHCRRFEVAFDQRRRIGEVTPGAALGAVEKDRRGVKQPEVLVEAGDCPAAGI